MRRFRIKNPDTWCFLTPALPGSSNKGLEIAASHPREPDVRQRFTILSKRSPSRL